MSENATPRTDAAAFYGAYVRKGEAAVDVEFARKLERELSAANARLTASEEGRKRAEAELAKVREALREIRDRTYTSAVVLRGLADRALASAPSAKEGQPGEKSEEGK